MKKRILIISLAALLLLLAAFILPVLLRNYTVNKPDKETEILCPAALSLYSGDKLGYSFLYPAGCSVGWEADDNSACIYGGEAGSTPYVLVCRTNKKNMNPGKYFRQCDRLMLDSFSSVESTPVQEVELPGKTLYLTRYVVKNGNNMLTIDRYLELYKNFYIQYTAISPEAGSLDTIVYYAASTLRTAEGAYVGAFTKKTVDYELTDINASISLPKMLDTKELTIGSFSSGENAVMLCVLCNMDDEGKAIYNRKDFIDRAAAAPEFVAGYLGADTASFTEGHEKNINGRSFYCYPMEMTTDGESFTGELCIGNADETGVYLLCWAVRNGCPAEAEMAELCQSCANTLKIK